MKIHHGENNEGPRHVHKGGRRPSRLPKNDPPGEETRPVHGAERVQGALHSWATVILDQHDRHPCIAGRGPQTIRKGERAETSLTILCSLVIPKTFLCCFFKMSQYDSFSLIILLLVVVFDADHF